MVARYDFFETCGIERAACSFQSLAFPFFRGTLPATRGRGSRDPRAQVTRPAGAGRATRGRGSLRISDIRTGISDSEQESPTSERESPTQGSKSGFKNGLNERGREAALFLQQENKARGVVAAFAASLYLDIKRCACFKVAHGEVVGGRAIGIALGRGCGDDFIAFLQRQAF